MTFAYLPALGVVTAEAGGQAHNELLATLFKDDGGEDTPNVANKYLDEGSFVFDTRATARPYRSNLMPFGLAMLSTEITRVTNHLSAVACHAMDIGATCFDCRAVFCNLWKGQLSLHSWLSMPQTPHQHD